MKHPVKKVLPPIMAIISALVVFTLLAFAGKSTDNSNILDKGNAVKQLNYLKSLKFSANLDNRYYYNNKDIYLNLEVKADEVKGYSERTPLNISVVIDKSGSMSSKNKLDFVKKAVEYIIDKLGYNDYISIVTYDDDVRVVYASSMVEDKTRLKSEVRKIMSGGFTNLSGGMNEGYTQVEKTVRRGYVNRVLLLSDGLANRGITDRSELANIVKNKSSYEGITISTFGVGNDFNENLMADIATYGKGNYYYIKNSFDIPEIFANELKGVRILAAQNTKIKVNFPSHYLSVRNVFGYHYEVTGDNLYIDLKDVFAGQKKTVLIKFYVSRRIDSRQEFESILSYDDARDDLRKIEERLITFIEPAYTINDYESGVNISVKQNVVRQEANDLMEQALNDADNGRYDEAREKIKKGKDYMSSEMSSIPSSPEMTEQYDNMDKYDKQLENAENKSEEERKEMQKAGKYQNYETRKK
ncbi:MAG: VWA domain-containing protein [Ignavibacteria bacterium]|nr:VWA domain-containing protein [Ignavibacteria bacterium]